MPFLARSAESAAQPTAFEPAWKKWRRVSCCWKSWKGFMRIFLALGSAFRIVLAATHRGVRRRREPSLARQACEILLIQYFVEVQELVHEHGVAGELSGIE